MNFCSSCGPFQNTKIERRARKMTKTDIVRTICHMAKGLSLVSLIFMMTVSSLSADALPDRYNAVTITDAMVFAAPSGGNSALHFRLVNESSETLTLIGVTSEHISGAKILAKTSQGISANLGSITIRAEETLDLHSSHLKILLTGLRRNFLQGQVVPLTLSMSRGGIPINAHVH